MPEVLGYERELEESRDMARAIQDGLALEGIAGENAITKVHRSLRAAVQELDVILQQRNYAEQKAARVLDEEKARKKAEAEERKRQRAAQDAAAAAAAQS